MTGDRDAATGCDRSKSTLEMTRLVDEHLPVLFAYAFRLTGSADEAEDLTQQTFLVAQERIGQLREAQKARPWLLKVLRNCFLKIRRKPRPFVASEVEDFCLFDETFISTALGVPVVHAESIAKGSIACRYTIKVPDGRSG